MSLTISEEFRMTAGGRAFRFMKITHDETTSYITAPSMGLDVIEFVADCGTFYASDIASIANAVVLSVITTDGLNAVALGLPAKATSTTRFFVIGW